MKLYLLEDCLVFKNSIKHNFTKLFISYVFDYVMKDIELKLDSDTIKPHTEIKGTITVNYSGRYDGIVVNTQILNSNELIVYKSYNDEKISQNVSRLFISKDVMQQNKAKFTAVIEFEPKETHEVKFRVSIIEQHKEIESDIKFARYST